MAIAKTRSKRAIKPDAGLVSIKEETEKLLPGQISESNLEELRTPLVKRLLAQQMAVTKVKPYSGRIPGYFSSGAYLLNLLLSRGLGFPWTKIIHLTGFEGSGKTFLCLAAAKQVLDSGGTVFWYNQEDGWAWDFASLIGIREDDPNFVLFPPMLAEKCFDGISLMLKNLAGDPSKVLFVIDSLGGSLTIDRNDTEVEKGRKMGDIQKLAKDFCAKTVPYIPMTMASIMVTNHVYIDINAFTPNPSIPKPVRPTGGKAVPYRAFIELLLTAQPIVKSSTGKVLHGGVRIKVTKNKGGIKDLRIDIPIFFRQTKNRYFGVDDGMTSIQFLVSEGVWKVVERQKRKVILTNYEPVSEAGEVGEAVYGTAPELRDRMLSDLEKPFFKFTQKQVEAAFLKKFGLD